MKVVTVSVSIEYKKEADKEEVYEQVHDALQRHLLSGGLDVSSSEAFSVSVSEAVSETISVSVIDTP